MPLSDLHFATDQWFLNNADDLTGTISGQVFCIEDLEIGEEYWLKLNKGKCHYVSMGVLGG